MRYLLITAALLLGLRALAQKKPLDHTVYDQWKSLGERLVTNDGQYLVYTVNPQEGDGELVIQHPGNRYRKVIPRGYQIALSEDSRFLVCRIKAPYAETRQARIRKKPAAEMPKDSLAILRLGEDSVLKYPAVKSFKMPEKGAGWVAFELEKTPDTPVMRFKKSIDTLKLRKERLLQLADSVLRKALDSIGGKVSEEKLQQLAEKTARQLIRMKEDAQDAEGEEGKSAGSREGAVLVLRQLETGVEKRIPGISEYYFDRWGRRLLADIGRNAKDSSSKALLIVYSLPLFTPDTVMAGFNDAKHFVFDEAGLQLGFLAERDSSEKSLQKFYRLWYHTTGMDTARVVADRNTAGMKIGFTVSEHGQLQFSRDGSRLFFGTAPVRPPRDTSLVEFETAKLDVWHYQDDYLQTQQLKNLDQELKRSYTAVWHPASGNLVQLGDEDAENITLADEGNAAWVLAESNREYRIPAQWEGRTRWNAWRVDVQTGERTLIYKGQYQQARPSPGGRYVYWYQPEQRHWFTYEVATGKTRRVTERISTPLYNEEQDVPDLPGAYGVMGWSAADSVIYVYDRFDIWRVSPDGAFAPRVLSLTLRPGHDHPLRGRDRQVVTRFINTDREQRYFEPAKTYLFSLFDENSKESGLYFTRAEDQLTRTYIRFDGRSVTTRHTVPDAGNRFFFSIERYTASPDWYTVPMDPASREAVHDSAGHFAYYCYPEPVRLSEINPQQREYNWGTASLFSWKAYDGKKATGILYKPEDYDPSRKYPLICYFYERLSDGLYSYIPPAPTPSRLNISFFVSRGYLVLAPDIAYQDGYPGNSAYNYVVSGARALVKAGMADSNRIGIQGQSWGGYQVAYLITRTSLFKAAWAGAPVANMTSAYGGIRWESGLNRQFQYEKQQSRIGASLWEKPGLYLENSPLFHLQKVKTPLVIMHNDADGAVPWYQGIELFTGLRRLGKPVWMLNYNGEQHNLVERRNRRDIQIREQQFFDWLLKGEAPPRWITEGIPAVDKGRDWGLDADAGANLR